MRNRFILFLKTHPRIIRFLWMVARKLLWMLIYLSKQQKTILFCSFGGRAFNDSPKAIYDQICKRREFKDWQILWAFVEPEKFNIPRGKKIKVDSYSFLKALVLSKIWVSNSGMDRGIDLITNKILRVETWHGTPLKRIGGEERQNTFGIKPSNYKGPIDTFTIRCAQSSFDRDIFSRIFHASKESILLSDLPRNDELLTYSSDRLKCIRKYLNIDDAKKVILYTPTYREYLINEKSQLFITPPINLDKWTRQLGSEYVLLVRAHYAVSAALNIKDNDFVKDVSSYNSLNDLYAISDMMISDYSSTYFDFSILNRPMFCFAYDKEEYEQKRGLYLDMSKELPCKVCSTEDEVIFEILNMNLTESIESVKQFHNKYAPYAGNASQKVVDEIISRLK